MSLGQLTTEPQSAWPGSPLEQSQAIQTHLAPQLFESSRELKKGARYDGEHLGKPTLRHRVLSILRFLSRCAWSMISR